jgi:hypothetical protein
MGILRLLSCSKFYKMPDYSKICVDEAEMDQAIVLVRNFEGCGYVSLSMLLLHMRHVHVEA